jgi:aminobenzoyl-glutamate transport protein
MRILTWIEKKGNQLPDPTTLFVGLCFMVIVVSWVLSLLGAQAVHPTTNEPILIQNLLSTTYLQKMLMEAVKNFAAFPPLGVVLVAIIGIGVAERSGLLAALLRYFVAGVPSWALPAALVFAGVMSSLAADTGYVVLIPLGAAVFASAGRHPLAGLAATFAGVSGGFSANLLITSLDPLLAGLSTEAARIVEPTYTVQASSNYYFMVASTFLITLVGASVNRFIVEPRLPRHMPEGHKTSVKELNSQEKKAVKWSMGVFVMLFGIVLALVLPQNGLLRDEKGELGPFYSSLIFLITIIFLICGLVYGIMTQKIKNDKDAVTMTSESMAQMGSYIVLVFFASQFLAYFAWSNIGIFTAIHGANFLKSMGFTGMPLLCSFVVVTALVNLFVGSASAKWALMAPVFVPMLMLVGYPPELTQAAYRVGDSTTNMISPLLPYFPLIIVFAKKYDPKAGLGTLISLMLPYSLSLLSSWLVLFILWTLLRWPLGF